MNCIRCGREHKGTPMRTDPRYSRIRSLLLDPAMPRTSDGAFEMCHHCQRWICWHGGMVTYLANQVIRTAKLRGVTQEKAF